MATQYVDMKTNKVYNVNPMVEDFEEYQVRGLDVHDRKPNDYLRAVAKTFSAFRDTDAEESIISYISGFEIAYELSGSIDSKVTESSSSVFLNDKTVNEYHSFKISAGTCIIDNQLINFRENTILLRPRNHFNKKEIIGEVPTKATYVPFVIVIFYAYNNQYAKETATIEIRRKNELIFPYSDRKEVCFLKYKAEAGNVDRTNGKFGLIIGSFNVPYTVTVAGKEKIYKDKIGENSALLEGINDQNLSQLYMNNYQLLFKYFGLEARKIFSEMQLTHSNFITVPEEQIHKTLRSGTMCYYDPIECCYKPARASQRRYDLVVGLYLKESLAIDQGNSVDKVDENTEVFYNSTGKTKVTKKTTVDTSIKLTKDEVHMAGSNVIFFNGIIHLSENRFQLDSNDMLLNLIPGQHYYLEDKCTILDPNDESIKIDDVVVSTATGKITNKPFTGAVQVGTALNNNVFLLNIQKEQELKVGSLLDIFGDNKTFEMYYNLNKDIAVYDYQIKKLTEANKKLEERYTRIQNILGNSVIVFDSSGDSIADFKGPSDNSQSAVTTDTFSNYLGYRVILLLIFRNLFGYDFKKDGKYLDLKKSIGNKFDQNYDITNPNLLNTDIFNKETGEFDIEAIEKLFDADHYLVSVEKDLLSDDEDNIVPFDNQGNILDSNFLSKISTLLDNNKQIESIYAIVYAINLNLLSITTNLNLPKKQYKLDKDYAVVNSNSKIIQDAISNTFEMDFESLLLQKISDKIEDNYETVYTNIDDTDTTAKIFKEIEQSYKVSVMNRNSNKIGYDDQESIKTKTTEFNNSGLVENNSIQETYTNILNALEFNSNMEDYMSLSTLLREYLNVLKGLIEFEKNRNYMERQENDLKIIQYTKEIERLKLENGNVDAPYALDIFMMDEYQRQIFNYTYLASRLKQKLWQRQRIAEEIKTAEANVQAANDSQQVSDLVKAEKMTELIRLNKLSDYHDQFISNYTKEFNDLRKQEQFNEDPIIPFDNNFSADYMDENLSTYRFGCEDHTYCYGGVCTNSVSPCTGMLYYFRRLSFSQSDVAEGKDIEVVVEPNKTLEILLLRHTDHNIDNYTFEWYNKDGYTFEDLGEVATTTDTVSTIKAGSGSLVQASNILKTISNETSNPNVGAFLDVADAFDRTHTGNISSDDNGYIVPKVGILNNTIGGVYDEDSNDIAEFTIENDMVSFDLNTNVHVDGTGTNQTVVKAFIMKKIKNENTWSVDLTNLEKYAVDKGFKDGRYVVSVKGAQTESSARKIIMDRKTIPLPGDKYDIQYNQVELLNLKATSKLGVDVNSEEFMDNDLQYTPYSTDSKNAIDNMMHDPAKTVSVQFKDISPDSASATYNYVLKISEIVGETSGGDKVLNLVDSIRYKFLVNPELTEIPEPIG